MQIDLQGKTVAATVVQYTARTGRHEVEWRQESSQIQPGAEETQSSRGMVDFAADLVYRELV
jgi:hypothetical protein